MISYLNGDGKEAHEPVEVPEVANEVAVVELDVVKSSHWVVVVEGECCSKT